MTNRYMQLPEITIGHLFYILIWALLVVVISAVAWPQTKMPTYKDFLASTLGISFEALGIELARGQQALIFPLLMVLVLALLLRYLPENSRQIGARVARFRMSGRLISFLIFITFFLVQSIILILAYRGWWEILLIFPG